MTPEEIAIFLRLVGTRQFVTDTEAASASVGELGVATEETGLAMGRTTRRSYLMNQALFTLRRLMYGTTLAIIGSGVAAAKWGWDFNSAMQQARVALQPVGAEIGGVQNELDYLFNFTKYTPFQFKDVTIAFRQMYLGMRTVGISADTVNQTLHAIVDSLSATGRTSPGALNRVSVALQHMAYMGHITGQVVMQLARDGLPIYAALSTQLHLTGDQIHNIGKLGIPSIVVLRALNRYIETTPGLMNAAHRQAINTFHGLFTTFRDNTSQIMGMVEKNFFLRLQNNLAKMNQWFGRITDQVRANGSSMSSVVRAIDPRALPLYHQLADDLHLIWVNFSNIVSALSRSQMLWGTFYIGLVLLHGVLSMLVPLTATLGFWLNILIPLWITYKGVTMAAAIATGINTFAVEASGVALKDLTFFQFLYNLYTGEYAVLAAISTAATWLYVTAQIALGVATDALSAAFLAARVAAAEFTAILLLNPIFLIVTAVALLIAGLVVLYFKWQWFHNLVNRTWNWIVDHKYEVALAISTAFAPLIGVYELLKHIHDIWHAIGRAAHWFTGGGGGGGSSTTTQFGPLRPPTGAYGDGKHFAPLPHLAGGGNVLFPGLSWIGERGPELMHMPAGATVTPNHELPKVFNLMESWMKNKDRGDGRPLIIKVVTNNREIGRAYATAYGDVEARS